MAQITQLTETPPEATGRRAVWQDRRLQLGAGVTGVAVIGALIAYAAFGGAPSFSGPTGDVTNAKDFLAAANQQWRSDLTRTPANQMNLASDATCYFVERPSSDILTGSVACGPVRRATAATGSVWDLYAFEQQGTTLTRLTSDAQSAGRPSGKLVSADGSEPPSRSDALAAPALPTAPPSLSQSYTLADGQAVDNQPDLASTVLNGPAGQLRLTAAGSLSSASITPDNGGSPEVVRPADGYEFQYFAWTLTPPSSTDCSFSCQTPSPSLTLIVGSKRTDLGNESVQSGGWLVSLPKGSDALLGLTAGSKEVTASVVSGKVTDDPQEALYALQNGTYALSKNVPTWTGAYDSGSGFPEPFTYDLSVSNVSITPYDTDRGWAPTGKAWLEVTASDNCSNGECVAAYGGWDVTVSGKSYPLSVDRLNHHPSGTDAFLVPVETRAAELHLQTQLAVSDYTGANTKSFTPTPLTASVSFS